MAKVFLDRTDRRGSEEGEEMIKNTPIRSPTKSPPSVGKSRPTSKRVSCRQDCPSSKFWENLRLKIREFLAVMALSRWPRIGDCRADLGLDGVFGPAGVPHLGRLAVSSFGGFQTPAAQHPRAPFTCPPINQSPRQAVHRRSFWSARLM